MFRISASCLCLSPVNYRWALTFCVSCRKNSSKAQNNFSENFLELKSEKKQACILMDGQLIVATMIS